MKSNKSEPIQTGQALAVLFLCKFQQMSLLSNNDAHSPSLSLGS